MSGPAIEALFDALERAARTADLAALDRLTPELAAAVAQLPPSADPVRAGQLAARAARLARQLDAARRGVQAARLRLADIRAAVQGGRTYDRQGGVRRLAPPALPARRL